MTKLRMLTMVAAGALLFALPVKAAEFEVKMLNKGSDKQAMVFEPAFIKIQPGDTVHFVPTEKGHDAETIPGFLPQDAKPFKGKMSEAVTVTFDVPGLYGYRCLPHFGMGMIGLVEVGDNTANLDAARQVKLPPLAAKRMAVLLEQASKSAGPAQPGAMAAK